MVQARYDNEPALSSLDRIYASVCKALIEERTADAGARDRLGNADKDLVCHFALWGRL